MSGRIVYRMSVGAWALFEIQSSLGSHWISWTAGEEERLTYYSPILRAINMTVAEKSNFKTDQPARLPWIRYQNTVAIETKRPHRTDYLLVF